MNDPQQRLAALAAYEIMDTAPEEAFDDLTQLTSFICDTPIALVTLLDLNRQWFKSKVGLCASETPIEDAFCRLAIEQQDVFLITNASEDDRFAANPLVTGEPNIRFYAGAPLITPEGVALGTLCAIDTVPRSFSDQQKLALQALARSVVGTLEMRRVASDLKNALFEADSARKEVGKLKDMLPMCAWCRKVRDDESFWHSVEDYIGSHSEIDVTHGICPDCATTVEGEIDELACSHGDGKA